MTDIAHNCVMYEIPVDLTRLFDGEDPNYELWLSGLLDRVEASHRQQERKAKKGKKGKGRGRS